MMMKTTANLQQRPVKKTLGEVSQNNNINAITHGPNAFKDELAAEYKKVHPEYWFRKYRKNFSTFRIFLDSIDSKNKTMLERKIKLLGGKNEVFYSGNCTHVITSKVFRDELPLKDQDLIHTAEENAEQNTEQNADQENKPVPETNKTTNDKDKNTAPKQRYTARDPAQQSYFDKAQQMNIEIWSIAKAMVIFSSLIDRPRKRAPAYRLGDMLEKEKKYGVNTSQQPGRTLQPQFVAFEGHYLMVEDGAGVHRPIIIRKYNQTEFSEDTPENERIYPWPKLYIKQDIRSPFVPPYPKSAKKQRLDHPQQQQQQDQGINKGPLQSTKQHQEQQQQQQNNNADNQNINTKNNHLHHHQENCIPNNNMNSTNNNNNNKENEKETNKENINENHPPEQDEHITNPPTILDNTQLSSKTPVPNTVYPTMSHQSKSTVLTTITTPTANHNNNNNNINHIITAPNTNDKLHITQPHFHRSGLPLYENMSRLDRRTISNQRNPIKPPLGDIATNSITLKQIQNHNNKENDKENKQPLQKNHHHNTQQTLHTTTNIPLKKGASSKIPPAPLAENNNNNNNNNVLGKRSKRAYLKYCENCHTFFEDMDKHMKEESHVAFIRDKNNFKDLDKILSSILNQTQ
ncbi:hypothetical protein BJ944DRAFT_231773 [Cunninghamella echinulata]|nr:hypothetical protein BJ944DRAFT_231773 [Cunninghamella echinulata]